jgi:hypothetical protein
VHDVEGNASIKDSMHLVTKFMSSGRNVSYHLWSQHIVKKVLGKALAIGKEIKKKKGIQNIH